MMTWAIPRSRGHHPGGSLLFAVLALLLLQAPVGRAAPRIIDRIDVDIGSEYNDILLYFNLPVRVISQVLSSTGTELNIQVQPTVTPGTEEDILSRDEVLSWKSTAEIPLDSIRFRPGRATSRLELSFISPVEATIVQKQRDFFSLAVRLKKEKRVERVELPEVEPEPTPKPPGDVPVGVRPAPPPITPPATAGPSGRIEAPAGSLVINLMSQTRPIDFAEIAAVPLPEDTTLYTTEARVNGQTWYRLRLGFFPDRNSAARVLKTTRTFYPKAWIDTAGDSEKVPVPGITPAGPAAPAAPRKPPIRLPKRPEDLPSSERLTLMMSTARDIMTAGDYPKAIRMLTAILEQPENRYTQEAQELLGLARERNGQLTHAYAEYEKYLQNYPEGEDADRVKQRLAGLATARATPQPALRKPREEKEKSPWDVFGSLSLAYRHDGINNELIEERTTRSEIDGDIYISARRSIAEGDLRMQLTGGYGQDLLSDGRGNVSSLSDAYVAFDHRPTKLSGRVGRQRLRSSGLLSRFDGAVVGYEFSRDVEAHLSVGIPVEKSSDTFVRDDKWFAGVNVEVDSLFENIDVNMFFVEQYVESLVDRRAVGGEIRYFKDDLSLFGLVDYDLFFKKLNTVLIQGNWNYSPQTALYLILDYRNTPTLTASNAVIGLPVDEFAQLTAGLSDDEIYQLARDRTARSKIGSVGGTHTFANDLQLSLDFTVAQVGSTPASTVEDPQDLTIFDPTQAAIVDSTESTGNEFFYTVQVSKPNLFKSGDIGILSLRYADASTSSTISLSANTRYPVTSLFRINPRLAVSRRKNRANDTSRVTFGALLQADYRLMRNLLLEGEIGGNYYDEENINEVVDFADYFLRIGFRWEF